jgi:osmoprotectant transport system ATP-binding protein
MASLRASDKDALLLLDDAGRPRRWVVPSDLRRSDAPLDALGLEIDPDATVRRQATLADALNELVRSRVGSAVVVDNNGVYVGTVDIRVIMAAAEAMRRAAREAVRADIQAHEAASEEVGP